jgi:hypothetical protein
MAEASTAGGLGGGSDRGIRDTRLAERALREGWPIPDEIRAPLIKRLARIAFDPGSSPREATSAARAILQASKLNLEIISAAIRAEEHEALAARVEEIERRLAQPADASTWDGEAAP